MEFYCQPCDKTLKTQVLFDKHCQCKMHLRGGKISYHCEKCDYTTTHKSKFNLHLKSIKCTGQSKTEKKNKDTIKFNEYSDKLNNIEKKYIENPNCIHTENELNKTKKTVKKYKQLISEPIVFEGEPLYSSFSDFIQSEKIKLDIPEITFNELQIPELKLNVHEIEYQPQIDYNLNIIDKPIIVEEEQDEEEQLKIQKIEARQLNKCLTIQNIYNMTENIYYINNFKNNYNNSKLKPIKKNRIKLKKKLKQKKSKKEKPNNIEEYIDTVKKKEIETKMYYAFSSDSESEPEPEPEPEPVKKVVKCKEESSDFNIFTMPTRKNKKKIQKPIIQEPIIQEPIIEQKYTIHELESSCIELVRNDISYYIDNSNIVYTEDSNRYGTYSKGEIIKDST